LDVEGSGVATLGDRDLDRLWINTQAIPDPAPPSEPVTSDLLGVLRKSCVLTDGRFDEVRLKVLSGAFPGEAGSLAERLVAERFLTHYQADRLLKNKPQSLIFGRYVIIDRVGCGSMGRVYKARHLLMDRVVALKIIAPEFVASARKIARFQREIRLISRLDHPNVVRAFDADRIANVPYIAMEYVQGQNLNQRLYERGPLPLEDVIEYAAQAAEGLAHAHDQGVVHRDVKPSNLLLGIDRQLKVLDFGLAALMEIDSDDACRTNDGVAVGTIDYMSPEQTCGQEIDGRSDLYSLGCSMYHLMTQRMLFPGASTIERLAHRAKGERLRIAEIHPEFPPGLVQVMEKMLAFRPQDRFQTALEAAEALWALTPQRRKALLAGKVTEASNGFSSAPAPTPAPSVPAPEPPKPASTSAPARSNLLPRSAPSTPAHTPLPPLFRFLLFLAEQSMTSIAITATAIVFVIFSAGFGLALLLK
jgi:eukaryotic-like serine/threonine-protein kinase